MNVCSAQRTTCADTANSDLVCPIALTPGNGNGDYTYADGDTNGRKGHRRCAERRQRRDLRHRHTHRPRDRWRHRPDPPPDHLRRGRRRARGGAAAPDRPHRVARPPPAARSHIGRLQQLSLWLGQRKRVSQLHNPNRRHGRKALTYGQRHPGPSSPRTVRRSHRSIRFGHVSKHRSAGPRVRRSRARATWTGVLVCRARTASSSTHRAGQRRRCHGLQLADRLGAGYPGTCFESSSGRCLRMPGAGGSIAFADPDAHIGLGYPMNKKQAGMPVDPRALSASSTHSRHRCDRKRSLTPVDRLMVPAHASMLLAP